MPPPKMLRVFKAAPIGDQIVPSARIVIQEEFPECSPSVPLSTCRQLNVEQGAALADILFQSLPGGTLDALLAEMMSRRACLLRVPLESGLSVDQVCRAEQTEDTPP